MNLLIHADAGARSGLIGSWLTNRLTILAFDTGLANGPGSVVIHQPPNVDSIIKHSGLKIRVRPSISMIDLHCLLFLRKRVYETIENFSRDEYSLETFTKLDCFSRELLAYDCNLDYGIYDIVIDLADTFNNKYMIDLYIRINKTAPSNEMIKVLEDTNVMNNIMIDKNHACSIVKLCLEKEQELGLNEEHRFWSIDHIYKTTPYDKLYDTVNKMIVHHNYGISLSKKDKLCYK